MKKLLILMIFLSSMVISSVAYSKWTEVSKSFDGDTFYVDLERIRKHDGKVYFRRLSNYSKPGYNGTMSSEIYIEAECGRFRLRWLNQTYYNGPMRSGKTLHSTNTPQKEWIYLPPDSAREGILKAVCNHKSMQ
jgi:hypothetical protein